MQQLYRIFSKAAWLFLLSVCVTLFTVFINELPVSAEVIVEDNFGNLVGLPGPGNDTGGFPSLTLLSQSPPYILYVPH